VVLNVGKAHLGEFGSQQAIAQAKGEIVEALRHSGGAVLNLDDPLVAAMAERTSAHLWTFGTHPDAVVRLGPVELDDLGRPAFDLTHGDATEHVHLQLLGEHQAVNAAAVTAAALAAGRLLPDVAEALRAIERLSPWRMEVAERADGLAVVNDAYNANPDSMVAALHTLSRMGRRGDRRTVAVLGEMRELGTAAAEEHRAVGEAADDLGIDVVLVVGHGAHAAYDALLARRGDDGSVHHLESAEDALRWLGENVAGPDIVLVKASRAAQLEKVAQGLLGSEPRSRLDQDMTATVGDGEETGR
jgi:UDP-N-acetylmuramoyl-tripeptide--D-alanyl-D-alanine ligase